MKNLKENNFEGLYIIGYGLSGGFGGAKSFKVIRADTQQEADEYAWESACEEYERYAGMHGLRGLSQIMKEDKIEDEDEAQEVFEEEREGWLSYGANPYSKEYERKVSSYHYHNPYTDITDEIED